MSGMPPLQRSGSDPSNPFNSSHGHSGLPYAQPYEDSEPYDRRDRDTYTSEGDSIEGRDQGGYGQSFSPSAPSNARS